MLVPRFRGIQVEDQMIRKIAVLGAGTMGAQIAGHGANAGLSFGTHFFTPPRYMRLLEIIPTPETEPHVLAEFETFAEIVPHT